MSEDYYDLPELITLSEYDGNFNLYLEAIYELFKKDFIEKHPVFQGTRVGLKKHPQREGKEATFWHMISEGEDEPTRVPDLFRMERIKWPAALINDSEHPYLKVWENKRGSKTNVLIFHEQKAYLVVLRKGADYLIPWTAYLITYRNRKERLLKEYAAYIKSRELT